MPTKFAIVSVQMDATTPPAESRKRWVARSESERASSKRAILASNPVQPCTRDTKYGPLLVLKNVPFEAKKLISREYVSANGHPLTAISKYVRYKGSPVEGQNNHPHYDMYARADQGYSPSMPVTCMQHARDVIDACKKIWPALQFAALQDQVEAWPKRHVTLLQLEHDRALMYAVVPVDDGCKSSCLDWEPPFTFEFEMFSKVKVDTNLYTGYAFGAFESAMGADPDALMDKVQKFWERYDFNVECDVATAK